MNAFFDVWAIHCWDTPVVFPVSAGLSLEDHRVSNALFFLSSNILVLRFEFFFQATLSGVSLTAGNPFPSIRSSQNGTKSTKLSCRSKKNKRTPKTSTC